MKHVVAFLVLVAAGAGLFCAERAGEERAVAAYDLAAKAAAMGTPRRHQSTAPSAAPVWLGAAASQPGVPSAR
jgi:hypothetical protein